MKHEITNYYLSLLWVASDAFFASEMGKVEKLSTAEKEKKRKNSHDWCKQGYIFLYDSNMPPYGAATITTIPTKGKQVIQLCNPYVPIGTKHEKHTKTVLDRK